MSFKEAAAQIMETAYMQVSGNGTVSGQRPADHVRARGHIQKVTGKQLESNYFTQTLLPDYLEENGVDWDVVYDARGHFTEPHDGNGFGLGTLEVRNYLAGLPRSRARRRRLQPSEGRNPRPERKFRRGAVH